MTKIKNKIQVMEKWTQDKGKTLCTGSLTRELALILVALVAGTVLICWLLSTMFLQPYYVHRKQNVLLAGFASIDEASAVGKLADKEFDIAFDNLCANGNITVMIMSPDQTIVRSSANDTQRLLLEFVDIIFGEVQRENVLVQADNYVIQRRNDSRLNAEYLMLYGTLSNGNLILMRSAFESIRESTKISNRFLLYTGIFAVVVSVFIAVYVSRRVMNPILELTDISKRMTELEFEVKYKPKGNQRNEIDVLGAHMNEMSATLERAIAELKSANNQLLIDIEKKTKIDHMRKEFLSNVSHELKTPLALISGYAEGLKECINEDPESRDFYCEVIMDEADKMNRMVKKLLTLNQLESGDEHIVMERFDLTELLLGVLESVRILIEQNDITVTACPDVPVYVWADEFMVEEVITNYLSNAIHYAKGRREISVSYEMRGELVRVCVFNTGDPIPEEDIGKIWNKFYKVDKARTREYGGNGIGLSIVKAVMESFHRECGAMNHPDGVEFWFELDTGAR